MSGYCIFDTETSGLADFTQPADAPCQPRLAQLALILCNDRLEVEEEQLFLIRPDGWDMPEAAAAVHGFTTQYLCEHGIPVIEALLAYGDAVLQGRCLIGHNVQYDAKVMRGELRRAGLPDLYHKTPLFCTMKAMTNDCRLPKATGRGFKWPKLAEASRFILGHTHEGAHDALADARTCLLLARWLQARNRLVHERMQPCA